ncbi:hypothetical protein C4564_02565 [Candidatus Microgenomates bacterium]|nr:MAG: hypothetical protein C4564_02565 [Candidatus Microgenomates bacterium]
MNGDILSSEVMMIGIDLPKPFPLAFGTLSTLPRVFLTLTFEGNMGEPIKAIGEASIDFPFSHYDAWDVYYALNQLSFIGLNVNSRMEILTSEAFRKILEYPASFAALNMALDDAYGQLNHVSVPDLYGQYRDTGIVLESISMPKDHLSLKHELGRVYDKGNVPKLKCGQKVEVDIQFLRQSIQIAKERGVQFAVDFNAAHTIAEFDRIAEALAETQMEEELILFLEQPTLDALGIDGLVQAKQALSKLGLSIPVMADESFVTNDNALECHMLGIVLNYKIQKVGGILVATEIEQSLKGVISNSMVGGTFPTAIGRVWDQQGICVLSSATLPCDAWQPSSDWFSGDRHLIEESFDGKAFIADGLGITVRWDLLERYKVNDPEEEYRLIRNGKSGNQIQILLREGISYSELYRKLNDKDSNWNL